MRSIVSSHVRACVVPTPTRMHARVQVRANVSRPPTCVSVRMTFLFAHETPHSMTHRCVRQIAYGNWHLVAGSKNKLAVDFLHFSRKELHFPRTDACKGKKYLKLKSKQFIYLKLNSKQFIKST